MHKGQETYEQNSERWCSGYPGKGIVNCAYLCVLGHWGELQEGSREVGIGQCLLKYKKEFAGWRREEFTGEGEGRYCRAREV